MLGTKSFNAGLGNIVDADVYTIHAYGGNLVAEMEEFRRTIGRPYGKLLLIEEFNPFSGNQRVPGNPLKEWRFESLIEQSRAAGVPWMFWEYGYNFDDDIWHANGRGPDGVFWGAKLRPGARKTWHTVISGRDWNVETMVDDLCTGRCSDCRSCDESESIVVLDTFSDGALDAAYEWFDEDSPDSYSVIDGFLTIEAGLYQDLWGGTPLKRGAPLILRTAPTDDYWAETFVTADPIGNPSQPSNTQIGLFIFENVKNWLFMGLTDHDLPGEVLDGLIAKSTLNDTSHIVARQPIQEDFAFLRVERSGFTWRFFWKLQHTEPWHLLAQMSNSSFALSGHHVGVGVKTFDMIPSASGQANFDYFSVGSR